MSTILQAILANFDPSLHYLYLAHDPDGVLDDETVLEALAAKGFRFIREPDPVALRCAVVQAEPIGSDRPVLVISQIALKQLPYDLWQKSHHVDLALHTFFPFLDYPTIRPLSPAQRSRLSALYAGNMPDRRLTPAQTAAYLLRHLFALTPAYVTHPAQLWLWLADYHNAGDPMPRHLCQIAAQELGRQSKLKGLPVADLLSDPDRFRRAMQEGFESFVQTQLPQASESGGEYDTALVNYGNEPALQDALPRLLRQGVIRPVLMDQERALPS